MADSYADIYRRAQQQMSGSSPYSSATYSSRTKPKTSTDSGGYDVPGILPTNLGFGNYQSAAPGEGRATYAGIEPPIPIGYNAGGGGFPTPTPLNTRPPGPGGTSGGGGGGGGGAPQLTQTALDQWLALAGRRPDQAQFSALDLPDYQAREFYAFNDQPYRQAEQALGAEIGAARNTIGTEMQAMRDYYASQGSIYDTAQFATNPMTRVAMERIAGALGTDPRVTNQTQREGAMQDSGFGTLMGILASNERQRNRRDIEATMADERRFNQGLDRDQRMLGLQGRLAEGQARGQYDQSRFAYQTEQDRYGHDLAMQEALANWQRQNAVSDTNVGVTNDWRSGLSGPILELMAAYPGLDYSAIGGLAA